MKHSVIVIIAIAILFAITGFQQDSSTTISSPVAGQSVCGTVLIEGIASGPNFQYYKIEIAEGDTPAGDAWRLLNNQTYDQPVIDSSLEGWDTTKYLDGVYSIRLRVVDNTGNYSEVVVSSITVQNTTPIIEEPVEDASLPPETWTVETVAQDLETFNEVVGTIYDSENSQLLLAGRFNPGLPADATVNLDDLVTAFRVIYDGEFPAVSIDPGDDINVMNVEYFGNTKETGLGWTMFEADRLLKVYSMGLDNNTNQPVASNVPGYKSELDLTSPSGVGGGPALWHRIWFEADDSEAAAVKQSSNKQAILFDQAQMVIKTEYISIGGSPNPGGSDPAAEAFVKHFNENFEIFAAEQLVLHRLNQTHRFLIIARWLRDQGIPLDKLWISEYEDQPIETPVTTPRRLITREFGRYAIAIGGGVDFFAENNYSTGNPEADNFVEAVSNIPSINGRRQGEVTLNNEVYSLASFPTQRQSYYKETDEAGSTWFIDNQSGNPLAYIAADGTVTNFDAFDEGGRPLVVTTHQFQNKRTFIYDNGTLDTIQYENELDQETLEKTVLADLRVLLARETDGPISSDQGFHLFTQDKLPSPNWATLINSSGEEELIWRITVQGEIRVVKTLAADEQPSTTDLISEITINGRRYGVFGGETAFYDNNRRLTFQHSTGDTNFVYLYPKNGNVAVQYGQKPETILSDLTFDQLNDLRDPELPGDERAEIRARFDTIITGGGDEILFSGQFPDTPEGVVITAHADQDLEQIINEAGGAGAVRDKLLILAVCGQDGNRDFATVLVKQYGATGVILTDGLIDIEAVQVVISKFVDLKDVAAYQAWFEAIKGLIESDEIPEALKIELQRLLESTMVISQAPLPDSSEILG